MTIKKYVYIGAGGAIGAMLRVAAKQLPLTHLFEISALNTLMVNLSGSFLLALFLGLALEVLNLEAEVRMGVGTGLMGGLTTFSTLCKEFNGLWLSAHLGTALLYVVISVLFGLLCAKLGALMARKIIYLKEVRS